MTTCPICSASLADDDAARGHAAWHEQLRRALRAVLIAADLGHRGLTDRDATRI